MDLSRTSIPGRTFTHPLPPSGGQSTGGTRQLQPRLRAPADVVAPSLVRYAGLLAALQGPSAGRSMLSDLPDELDAGPASRPRGDARERPLPASSRRQVLVEFVLDSHPHRLRRARPPRIPARVRPSHRGAAARSVYLATTDEQQEFLRARDRAFLRASPDERRRAGEARRLPPLRGQLLVLHDHRRRTASERVLDVYTGLRNRMRLRASRERHSSPGPHDRKAGHDRGRRRGPAAGLAPGRVRPRRQSDADERQVLRFVNEAFDVATSTTRRLRVDPQGRASTTSSKSSESRPRRQQATPSDSSCTSATTIYKDALPRGLWSALKPKASSTIALPWRICS